MPPGAQSVHGYSLPCPRCRGCAAAGALARPGCSAVREVPGRGPAGLGGPAQETGQELQLRLVVLADDLVYRAVHPGIEGITGIEMLGDPDRLSRLDVSMLDG